MADDIASAATSSWGKTAQEQYAAGADDVEVMAALGLSRKDFENYYNNNPVFRDIVDIGRIKASAWWRKVAREHLFNKSLNVAVWNFVMKNREGWAEKSESTNVDVSKEQKSTDELRSEILAKLPGVAKQLGAIKRESEVVVLPKEGRDE